MGSEMCIRDSFNSGQTTFQFGAGVSTTPTTGGSILGGQRVDSVVVPSLSGSEFFGTLGFNGDLVLSQGSSDEIIAGLNYNSLGGTDLTNGGIYQNFLLDFTSLDDSTVPLTNVLNLSVSSGGTTVSQNVTIPDQNSATEVLVNFSNFSNVDLTAVDSVELEFDFTGNPGRDLQLGSFSVTSVPEPGSLVVLSCALSAMLLRRRRR